MNILQISFIYGSKKLMESFQQGADTSVNALSSTDMETNKNSRSDSLARYTQLGASKQIQDTDGTIDSLIFCVTHRSESVFLGISLQ